MSGRLGCAETCLSGKLEKKLEILGELGLWLELVNTGQRDLSVLESYEVEVRTVQAYKLHELPWLSKKKEMRESADRHVLESVRIGEKIGAEYVLTVASYGFDLMKRPREECIENYRKISKETDLVILIEALSPRQTSFLPSLSEVAELVGEIARDNVGLAADTWHVKESSEDVAEALRRSGQEIIELHLRDTNSKPPGKGRLNFEEVLKACTPPLLCLEFRTGTKEDVASAYRLLEGFGL